MLKRMLTVLICLGLVIVTLSGCGFKGVDKSTGAKEQLLTVGEMWAIDSIDPATDGTLLKEKALVVETLVECEPDFALKPGLAVAWQYQDPNTWRLELRKDVKFHDGTPLTAKEVKWSLERAVEVNPRVKTFTKIASIEVLDDHALQVTTSEPNADLPASLTYASTAVISPKSVDDKGEFVAPIGTGPFKFEKWNQATGELVLVKNGDYWGAVAKVDRLVIRPLPDPNTRALALEKGEIDFTCDPPYSELDRLAALQGIKVERHATARNYIIHVNLNKEPFNDLRVRQAISHAINRKDIVDHVLYGCGTPAAGVFGPGIAWRNEKLTGYAYDPEKARQLLSAAGWKDTDGDGFIDKNGKPLRLSLFTYPQRPGLPPMAQAIQDQLKQVGLNVEIEVMEFDAITQRVEKGQWDMKLGAYATAMLPTPVYYLQSVYHSEGKYAKEAGYKNREVDRLIEDCIAAFDQKEKYALSGRVQEMVEADLPVITVAHYGVAVAMKDKIRGYVFNPTAHDYMLSSEMYIEESSR